MLYKFTGPYTRFYPDIRGADGKSLMAEPGDIADFPDTPPGDGCWIPVEADSKPDPGRGRVTAAPESEPDVKE